MSYGFDAIALPESLPPVTNSDGESSELPKTGLCGFILDDGSKCERFIETTQGMAVHRSRSHGIKGESKGKGYKRPGKNKGKARKNVPAVIEPKTKRPATELLAGNGILNGAVLLEAMFPDGIPHSKIRATVGWVEATQELVK